MTRKHFPAALVAWCLVTSTALWVGLVGCGSETPGPQRAEHVEPAEGQPAQPEGRPAAEPSPETPEEPAGPGPQLPGTLPDEPGAMEPGTEPPGLAQPPLGESPPLEPPMGIEPPAGVEPGRTEPTPGEPSPLEPFSTPPPHTELPGSEVPGSEVPGVEIPGMEAPRTEIPGTELPPAERPPGGLPPLETPSTPPSTPAGTPPAAAPGRLNVTSSAFQPGQPIPKRYTGDGEDVSPPLAWSGLPAGTKQLALICDDPDAPRDEPWVHWVIYAIPPETAGLPEGVPRTERLANPRGALQGRNSWPTNNLGYRGPAPPPAHGPHRYFFKLYALDTALTLKPGLSKDELLGAIRGHVLAEGQLLGTYDR